MSNVALVCNENLAVMKANYQAALPEMIAGLDQTNRTRQPAATPHRRQSPKR